MNPTNLMEFKKEVIQVFGKQLLKVKNGKIGKNTTKINGTFQNAKRWEL